MAKRRNRNPNISPEVLERARQQVQATGDSKPGEPESNSAAQADDTPHVSQSVIPKPQPQSMTAAPAPKTSGVPTSSTNTYSRSRAERRASNRAGGGTRSVSMQSTANLEKRPRRVEEMSGEYVAHLLANPTKTVSEAELHAQYGFVLKDLRNMFILAGGLFGLLVVLAVFLVR